MAHALMVLVVVVLVMLVPEKEVAGTSNDDKREVCYDVWGCFNYNAPWNNPFVFSTLPERPSTVRTSFKLYNEAKPGGVRLNKKNPTTTYITAGDKIVILVHGLSTTGGHDESMYAVMRPKLLARTNADGQRYLNVITVDWTRGVKENNPLQSFANGRLVAEQIAYLIKKLKAGGNLACSDVHIIGFSLGASIVGLAGKASRRNGCVIGRITGLDPAPSLNSFFEAAFKAVSNETKLYATDAAYVDVLHTNTNYKYRVGTVDFNANNPSGDQPGCSDVSCNHFRAVRLFTSTIEPSKDCCTATKCRTYDRFTSGKCTNHYKRKMGFAHGKLNVPEPYNYNGKYFFATGSADPYCTCSGRNSGGSRRSGNSGGSKKKY